MISFDDLTVLPNNTFSNLFDKIAVDCQYQKTRAMTFIDLHTLCSLCLPRHFAGKLNDHKRKMLHKLLTDILEQNKIEVPHFYRSYIEMAQDVLNRTRISTGELMSELLRLKVVKRVGWNTSRLYKGCEIQRNCPNPESVAEHTLGCLMIADVFLPEHSRERNYSKAEILRILLIHDLAEAYEGDKAAFNKTEDDIRNENRRMHKIAALGGIKFFSGIRSWRKSWEEFQNRRGINGQIAKDLDLIECYIQMLNYVTRKDCTIPDATEWAQEIANELQTGIGKEIFNQLRHEGASLLDWYAKPSPIT